MQMSFLTQNVKIHLNGLISSFFLVILIDIERGNWWFLFKVWKMIKNTQKTQKTTKNVKIDNLFFQKMIFPWRRSKAIFFIVDSDRYFKGVFLKNYKNFEISVLLCPGCLEWPPLGANFCGGGKKNP